VIVNSHDANLFRPGVRPPRRFMEDGTLRLVYAGALTPLYEVEVAVEAVQRLRVRAPGLRVRFEVVGRGDREAHVRQRVAELGVGESVRVWGRVPLEDVPDAMAAADVGLALTRSTAYTQLSLSTKVFEYAAMERPIVASRLPMVRHYFGDSVLEYESGDPEALAAALLDLIARPREREQRVELAAERASALRWEVQGARYLTIVQALAG
jgi:glycosyltransferase involved in cell wall biosynthesis